jgi:sugar phosphate permease
MHSPRGSLLKATNIVLLIICLMYLITYVDRVNIATAAPPMQKELALSSTELGIAISAFAYPYAFFQIAGGWLGDRARLRMTLLICGTIWSAATVLIGFVQGALSLVLARLLLGIGSQVYAGCASLPARGLLRTSRSARPAATDRSASAALSLRSSCGTGPAAARAVPPRQ